MAIAPVLPLFILIGLAGAGALALSADRSGLALLLHRVLRWHDRQRQRAALLDLDARLLRDVGLTREQAQYEGRRHD